VDKEDTTYTDGAGKEYTVKRVRLVGGAKGEKGKPGSLFRFTVISP